MPQVNDRIQVRRFNGVNVLLNPATEVNPDDPPSFAMLENCNLFQEGAIRPRGGLGRPNSWNGFFAAGGKLSTGKPAAAFGSAIDSLHAIDFRYKAAPKLCVEEGGATNAPSGSLTNLATSQAAGVPWSSVIGDDEQVYMLNGIDRPKAWDGNASTTRNWGIEPPASALTAATGAGGALSAGDYYYYWAWLNSNTGCYSTVSPISNKITATAGQKGSISGVLAAPADSDSQITHWRLFRNTAGDATVYYKVADIAVGTTTYNDVSSDITIQANDVMYMDNSRPDGKYVTAAFFNGRILLWGTRVEQSGTVTYSNGSASVTGSGTRFTSEHVGQYIRFANSSTRYTILSVTDSTHLTLSSNYSGTGGTTAYSIIPSRASDVAWSRSTNLEAFPFANSMAVGVGDGDLPTGFLFNGNTPFLAKETKIYRLTFSTDPSPITGEGAAYNILSNRGMLNPRCCASVGSESYVMDRLGIYLFTGDGANQDIDMGIRLFLQPSSEDVQVNYAYSDLFHGVWEPKSDQIVFFCVTGSDTKPKTAFCYDRTRQRWSVWSFPQAITASILLRDGNGKLRAWVGDENGCIWALNALPGIDGTWSNGGNLITGQVGAATSTTLTCGDFEAFNIAGLGLQGVPVTVYSGLGAGQTRIVQSNTDTTLTISSAWTTTPDGTSFYRLGAVEVSGLTQWFSFGAAGFKKTLENLVVYFEPTSDDSTVDIELYLDHSGAAFTEWDASSQYDGVEIAPSGKTSVARVHLNKTDGRVVVPLRSIDARIARISFTWPQVDHSSALLGFDLFCSPQTADNIVGA